jgi:hypothetical protein
MTALAEAAPPPARVQGYVEAITDRRIVGWAWSPAAPDARLRIVLRDGDAVLESVLADQPRPDLAQNGVGDGAHAFAFELDPAWSARARELDVVAIAPDDSETPLGAPPAPARAGEDVRRVLDGLVGSQRVMHRNLQALLLAAKAREPLDAAIERIGQTQQALDARTAELELFVTRLDERLAALDRGPAPARSGPALRLALGAALAVSVAGFVGVAAHLLP